MECKTCEYLKKKEDTIFETKFWKISLAEDQTYLGKCIVDLKRHAEFLSELKKEEIIDFLQVIKKLENSIKKSFNATMFNWSCSLNNAYKSSSPCPHIHWHLRPRYHDKEEFENIIFEDKEFGHEYNNKARKIIPDSVRKKIIDAIRENF